MKAPLDGRANAAPFFFLLFGVPLKERRADRGNINSLLVVMPRCGERAGLPQRRLFVTVFAA
jgi:hypothetical protein